MRFLDFVDFLKDLGGFCYTSPPRGNQVGDLPRALSGPALIGDFACENVFAVKIFRFVLRCRNVNRLQLC